LRKTTRTVVAAPVLGFAALLAFAGPAAAAEGTVMADLGPVPVNPVGDATGQAMVEISGTTMSFTLAAQGLLAGAPHAAHIHFGEMARHMCPVDTDNNAAALDGETMPESHFTTTEGAPAYGDIVVSLTNSGDTSPDSGLAVDRFGTGEDIEYSQAEVQVSQEVADAILAGEGVVVVHGVDYDEDGTYSPGDRGVSDLDPSLPGEATDPAICGILSASQMGGVPSGGVETGAGSTSGVEHTTLIGAGVGALAAAGGVALYARRRFSADS
jgi:hypothetical protein